MEPMQEKQEEVRVRCSSLPRILSCTASAEAPEVTIDTSADFTRMGDAAHAFYERMVTDKMNAPDDALIHSLSVRFDVDADELEQLAWQGLREWKKVRDRIDLIGVEKKYRASLAENIRLSGHVDLIGRMNDEPSIGIVVDWKAGYKESGYLEQVKGYALLDYLLSASSNRKAERYLMLVVFTRMGITDTVEITAGELEEFRQQIVKTVTSDQTTYAPSDSNCEYCPVKRECPARRVLMRGAYDDITAIIGQPGDPELVPAKLVELYPQTRILKKALEEYEKQVKEAVKAAGGEIETDAGTLSLNDVTRRTIQWAPHLLNTFLTEDQIAGLTPTIGKKQLEDAVAANAPRGQKGSAKQECMKKLTESGYVKETTSQQIKFKKAS